MKINNIFYCFFLFSLLYTCCGFLMGYRNLGDGYFFIQDPHFSAIIYSEKNGHTGSGLEIIPPEVVQVEYDKRNIIAINIDYKTKLKNYWIIEKDKALNIDECLASSNFDEALKSNVIGPMDSTTFFSQLSERNINLLLDRP